MQSQVGRPTLCCVSHTVRSERRGGGEGLSVLSLPTKGVILPSILPREKDVVSPLPGQREGLKMRDLVFKLVVKSGKGYLLTKQFKAAIRMQRRVGKEREMFSERF